MPEAVKIHAYKDLFTFNEGWFFIPIGYIILLLFATVGALIAVVIIYNTPRQTNNNLY